MYQQGAQIVRYDSLRLSEGDIGGLGAPAVWDRALRRRCERGREGQQRNGIERERRRWGREREVRAWGEDWGDEVWGCEVEGVRPWGEEVESVRAWGWRREAVRPWGEDWGGEAWGWGRGQEAIRPWGKDWGGEEAAPLRWDRENKSRGWETGLRVVLVGEYGIMGSYRFIYIYYLIEYCQAGGYPPDQNSKNRYPDI